MKKIDVIVAMCSCISCLFAHSQNVLPLYWDAYLYEFDFDLIVNQENHNIKEIQVFNFSSKQDDSTLYSVHSFMHSGRLRKFSLFENGEGTRLYSHYEDSVGWTNSWEGVIIGEGVIIFDSELADRRLLTIKDYNEFVARFYYVPNSSNLDSMIVWNPMKEQFEKYNFVYKTDYTEIHCKANGFALSVEKVLADGSEITYRYFDDQNFQKIEFNDNKEKVRHISYSEKYMHFYTNTIYKYNALDKLDLIIYSNEDQINLKEFIYNDNGLLIRIEESFNGDVIKKSFYNYWF